jgi:glycosyltransferase involved in cell wall biosynthesis
VPIGVDATPLLKSRSGIGTYTDNLIRAMVASTSAPEIILLVNRTPGPDCPMPRGCLVHQEEHSSLRAVWMQLHLPSVIRRLSLDLCHFPNYLAPVRTPCPLVVTFHDMALFRYRRFFTWKKRVLTRSLTPVIARRADAIITVSQSSRREIMRLLGIPPQKIHVVYEAADPCFRPVTDLRQRAEVRARYGLPDRFLLSVGTLEPRKNLCRLVDAFEALVDADPALRHDQLVFVGERGWQCDGIIRRIDRLKERGKAVELGYVPIADLPAIYSLAQAVAYPSLYEGFGLPVLEAMACGVPVLTSDCSSLSEIAGSAALLVDPESTEAIRSGLGRILKEKDLACDLAGRGLDHVRNFSWKTAAEETLEVYHRVAHLGRTLALGVPAGTPATPPSSPLAAGGSLSQSVLRALHYADLFDFPLTASEIHSELIGLPIDRGEVERCLQGGRVVGRHAERKDGVYFLPGRSGLPGQRAAQETASDLLIAENLKLLRRISRLPFLRMLALSGGTSHKNSPRHHDIDLFIVTARGRVWITYALVVLTARLHRRRAVICANYLVDEEHLRLPQSGDLFAGHQILHLKPVTGARLYRTILMANSWVRKVFPNARPDRRDDLYPLSRGERAGQRFFEILPAVAWVLAEPLVRRVLGSWLRRKANGSAADGFLAGPGILKLHVRDHRESVVRRFRARLEGEGLWQPALGSLLELRPAPAPAAAPSATPAALQESRR